MMKSVPAELPGVDVHAVLSLLGEADGERDDVVVLRDAVRHVLRELLLLHPVLVQRRHEVRQRPRGYIGANLMHVKGLLATH